MYRRKPLHQFLRFGINVLNVTETLKTSPQPAENAIVILVQKTVSLIERRLDVLGMREGLAFLFQLLLSALRQSGTVQFAELEAHELLVFLCTGNLFFQFRKLFLRIFVALESRLISRKFRAVLCDNIHDVQLEIIFLQEQVLMLRVNVYELFAQRTHHLQRHRGVIDESS